VNPSRPVRPSDRRSIDRVSRRRPLAALLAGLLLLAAFAVGCSGSDDPSTEGGSTSAPGSTGGSGVQARLAEIADGVIVPAYQALAENVTKLGDRIDAVCTAPSTEALDEARAAWRSTYEAWQFARPGNVGPAMERRLMSAVGFEARPKAIAKLLDGTDPIDPEALSSEGAPVRGLHAVEEALFGEGADTLLTEAGARRCTYAASAVDLVGTAVDEVLADWNDGYRDTFVDGPDGDPMASVAVIMNQLTHRLQELDDRGLRDLAAGGDYDDLKDARKDGPAAYGMAGRKALLDGLLALVGTPGSRAAGLVEERKADTAERLVALAAKADEQVDALPASMRETFADNQAVVAADEALAELKVLVSTEAASQLGVTITFSDSDGDG
jgi:predicted lipoprotein